MLRHSDYTADKTLYLHFQAIVRICGVGIHLGNSVLFSGNESGNGSVGRCNHALIYASPSCSGEGR
jgi:hypothetical protein